MQMGALGQSIINNQLTETQTHINFLLHPLWELIIVVWGEVLLLFCFVCFLVFFFPVGFGFFIGGGVEAP